MKSEGHIGGAAIDRAHQSLPLPQKLLAITPRLAWQLVIASLLPLFAYPVLCLARVGRSGFYNVVGAPPFFQEGAQESVLPVLAREPWAWEEWQMWGWPVSAVLLPLLIHRWQSGRSDGVYRLSRSSDAGWGYRGAPALMVKVCARSLRRRIAIYLLRLGLAIALCSVPMERLFSSRFTENWGCAVYMVRSVPDYYICAASILAVLAFHVPTERRLLGPRPPVNKPIRGCTQPRDARRA